MSAPTQNNGHYAAEINITPLVDVVLVLLIIFMIIVPVMMRGYDVSIPGEAKVAPPADEERAEQIVLHIEDANCAIVEPPQGPGLPGGCVVYINDTPVTVESLAGQVATVYADRNGDDRVLFLAAQPALNYEYVMRILDAARSQVADLKIGLVTVG